jgi:hypothetical protein
MPSVLDPIGLRDWDRQRDEPPACWFAFKTWRDAQRRMTFVELGDILEVDNATIGRWASEWSWKTRKLAYDRWVDEGAQQHARATAEDMAEKHLTGAAAAREVALQALESKAMALQADPSAVSASAAALLLKTATDIERGILGKPVEVPDSPADYSKLTDAEFRTLVELQRKALA